MRDHICISPIGAKTGKRRHKLQTGNFYRAGIVIRKPIAKCILSIPDYLLSIE